MSARIDGWLLAALASVVIVGGCSRSRTNAEQDEEQPVVLGAQDVATATRARLTSGVVLTGTLEPAWRVSVKAQVPGTIRSMAADRGTRVGQGQVLAVIEAEGIRGAAESARAAVAAAQANLAVARQRLESARTLREAGAMSAIDFQTAQAAYEAAEAQLAAARAQAAGATEQAQRATVRSPIAGVVGSRTAQIGEAVSPGDELFVVVRSDVLELSGNVPVDAAAQIRPGQVVVFTVSGQPKELRGEVARIEPVADPATRQVGVYLRLRNPGNIIGGQFATGRVLGAAAAETVVVPEAAVRGGDQPFVLVIKDGRVTHRPVTMGATDPVSGLTAILSGVEAGEQVIVTAAALPDQTRVQIAAPTEPAPAAPREN